MEELETAPRSNQRLPVPASEQAPIKKNIRREGQDQTENRIESSSWKGPNKATESNPLLKARIQAKGDWPGGGRNFS